MHILSNLELSSSSPSIFNWELSCSHHPLLTHWLTWLEYSIIQQYFLLPYTHPTIRYSKTTWHNPNAHIAKPMNKWESKMLTTSAMMGNKGQWVILLCTRLTRYWLNTFIYAAVTLNYNKVMCIITKSHAIATLVEY